MTNEINTFRAPTVLFPLIFLANLFIAFDAKLLTNRGNLSLCKRKATFVSAFSPTLTNQESKDPLDGISLHI